jgi:hypothetical protein
MASSSYWHQVPLEHLALLLLGQLPENLAEVFAKLAVQHPTRVSSPVVPYSVPSTAKTISVTGPKSPIASRGVEAPVVGSISMRAGSPTAAR